MGGWLVKEQEHYNRLLRTQLLLSYGKDSSSCVRNRLVWLVGLSDDHLQTHGQSPTPKTHHQRTRTRARIGVMVVVCFVVVSRMDNFTSPL